MRRQLKIEAMRGTFLVLAFAWLSLPAAAQDRGDDRDRRRSWDPAERLKEMDANGDGQLSEDEISERFRPYLMRVAERGGIDTSKPIPVDALVNAWSSDRRSEDRGSSDRDSRQDSRSDRSSSRSKEPVRLVPGFGETSGESIPPGFGMAAATGTVNGQAPAARTSGGSSYSSGSSRSSYGSSSGSSGSSSSQASEGERTRAYAKSTLQRYDTNKNGVLEKDEASKLSSFLQGSDINKDGQITEDELAARLASYSRESGRDGYGRSDQRAEAPPVAGESYRVTGDRLLGGRTTFRPRSVVERAPKGLPDWFLRNDANTDGQISMAEFAVSWSADKLAEFEKFDLDGDGVITPAEALSGGKPSSASSSDAKTTGSTTGSSASGGSTYGGGSSYGSRTFSRDSSSREESSGRSPWSRGR